MDEDRRGIQRKLSLPGPGSQLIPGNLRAESAGTKAPEDSGRERTGVAAIQVLAASVRQGASDPLIAAAAAGRHLLQAASRGRPSAPHGSGPWATGSRGRTMKGGAPGEGLALTPRSPAPPLPQAAAWDPPGTPRSRRFPHGLARGLQPAWPAASMPPTPDSSIMGSQELETAEAAAPGGPFALGKGLSASPGCGARRCHDCPHGTPGSPRGALHPTAPQQPSGFCPHPATCLSTPTGCVVLTGQASGATALMQRTLKPHLPVPFHHEVAIKDNPWPRGGPFTKGGPGPPAYSGGGARRHCQPQTPS